MADAVTATTVEDGPRKAVIYCTNTSDGTGEAAVVKVDVSALASLQDGTRPKAVESEAGHHKNQRPVPHTEVVGRVSEGHVGRGGNGPRTIRGCDKERPLGLT
jgi:hypothetical protein